MFYDAEFDQPDELLSSQPHIWPNGLHRRHGYTNISKEERDVFWQKHEQPQNPGCALHDVRLVDLVPASLDSGQFYVCRWSAHLERPQQQKIANCCGALCNSLEALFAHIFDTHPVKSVERDDVICMWKHCCCKSYSLYELVLHICDEHLSSSNACDSTISINDPDLYKIEPKFYSYQNWGEIVENKFVFGTELNNRRKPFYDDKNLQQSEDEEEDEIENSWILLEEPENNASHDPEEEHCGIDLVAENQHLSCAHHQHVPRVVQTSIGIKLASNKRQSTETEDPKLSKSKEWRTSYDAKVQYDGHDSTAHTWSQEADGDRLPTPTETIPISNRYASKGTKHRSRRKHHVSKRFVSTNVEHDHNHNRNRRFSGENRGRFSDYNHTSGSHDFGEQVWRGQEQGQLSSDVWCVSEMEQRNSSEMPSESEHHDRRCDAYFGETWRTTANVSGSFVPSGDRYRSSLNLNDVAMEESSVYAERKIKFFSQFY